MKPDKPVRTVDEALAAIPADVSLVHLEKISDALWIATLRELTKHSTTGRLDHEYYHGRGLNAASAIMQAIEHRDATVIARTHPTVSPDAFAAIQKKIAATVDEMSVVERISMFEAIMLKTTGKSAGAPILRRMFGLSMVKLLYPRTP